MIRRGRLNALFNKSNPLYLLTDPAIAGLSHSQIARKAISSGIKIVQIREKKMSKRELFSEALKMREITSQQNVTFIVNDYIDIALAADADGVHLGQNDMPVREARKLMGKKRIIGISTHNLRQALLAENEGADYIGFGPMFATSTKNAGRPRGIRALENIRKQVNIPIVAIGGIRSDNIRQVLNAGADSVAVASAILSGDIKENINQLLHAIN